MEKERNIITLENWYKKVYINGKGKLYNYFHGKLIFEGDFLYGYKVTGKGFIKGAIEYEGEYNYGRKWNGKGCDKNHNVIYELINGNTNIKEYINDKLIYEGGYLNGKKNGKGKNIISIEKYYLKGYILEEKNGMEKDMINLEI